MATFTPRTIKPGAGNKYYIRKASGGWNPAIKGKPTDKNCDVLANCVGYAIGRFNEIGGYGKCKYLRSANAENFIQCAGNLEVGQTPKLGAVAVWRKGATLSGSDGAGHVAIVEKIISDTQIVTSESGYNAANPFWTQTRNKGNGNWGAGSAYTFLGFIYNPAPCCNVEDTAPKLTENGKWDTATTKRLQQIFGTTVDGKISNQWKRYKNSNPGLGSGWNWWNKPNGKGSLLIKAMQKWAGMPASERDGEIGPATIKAFQAKLGTTVDGYVSNPSQMVKALQKWVNSQ